MGLSNPTKGLPQLRILYVVYILQLKDYRSYVFRTLFTRSKPNRGEW